MPRTASAYSRRWIKRRTEAHMTESVTVTRPGDQVLDTITGQSSALSTQIYSGPARVWTVNDSGVQILGEGDIPIQQFYVSIPFDTVPAPHRDDIVTFVSTNDPDLIGRKGRVIGLDGGGLIPASRRLTVFLIADNNIYPELT